MVSDPASDSRGILSGIRVLDFGRYIAGPYCGALLADLGADVIRVEKIGGSEDRFLAPIAPSGEGGMFLQCNRGKRGMTLDPVKPRGREVLERLVRTADVVVANLPPKGLAQMGLDYRALAELRPDVILAAQDAFGPAGPWAGRVGFDAVGQAMSGGMYLSGPPGVPDKSIVNYVDFTTALSATIGVLAALFERQRTGRGQKVEASLLRSALTLTGAYLTEQAAVRPNREATHNRSQFAGPSDVFATSDGHVVVQVVGQRLFERWARATGHEALVDDERFRSDESRGDNGAVLSEHMAAWCATRSTQQVLSELDHAGVPAAPVLSPAEALEHPQVVGSGYLQPVPFEGMDVAPLLSVPPVGLGRGAEIRGPAPRLGEHTVAILESLGYTDREIAELRDGGVV